MATIAIEIPDDAFSTLHRSPKELSREMRLASAMFWYTQGRLSHEKAAQFAGVSRIAFIDALAAAKLPAFHVDVDELMEEVAYTRESIREHVAAGVLARENLLEILREGALEVIVPQPVIEEIRGHGQNDPTVEAIQNVHWLRVVPAPMIDPVVGLWDLGPGESAVLSLALAETGSWAVIDDLEARRCARSLGIPFIGTLGLVILAKQIGRIPAARPVVERLRISGMYLSDRVINEALATLGE